MDSLLVSSSTDISSQTLNNYTYNSKNSLDALIIGTSLSTDSSQDDTVDFDFTDLSKGISITAQEIVAKLNALLKAKLPDGIESIKPEDNTADATATRIVQGSTAFFDTYAKQNPELTGKDLLDSFLQTIKSGIQSGYDDAYNTLDGLGAFDIDGIRDGVEQTKILIEQKLSAFYDAKSKELGVSTSETEKQVSQISNTAILSQAGSQALSVYA